MFKDASSFNQSIEEWNTSQVPIMAGMFKDASSFNQSLDAWDTSAVKFMNGMFIGASSFNQCLSTWAGKSSTGVATTGMFSSSDCPYKNDPDPDPTLGAWC